MFIKRIIKVLLIAVVAFSFASVATAYAAANTVPASNAGDGSGAITGYVISTIHYNLNAINPELIDSVTFTSTPAVIALSVVKIQLDPAGPWYACTFTGTNVTCLTASATVLLATNLHVVIAE